MPEPQAALPDRLRDVDHLEDVMTTPSADLTAELGALAGDLVILGAGGKIGPTLNLRRRLTIVHGMGI